MIEGRAFLQEWLKTVLWWTQQLLDEFSEVPDALQMVGIDAARYDGLLRWEPPPL